MSAGPVKGDDSRPERREGRGRLSSIELLPEEAEPDILWASDQLRERTMPAKMIWQEFNARLADRGIGPVSKSAWSRYSVRKAIQFRELDQVGKISSELVTKLGLDGPDQVTVAVAEMLKVAAFQILEGGDVGTKGLMELSRALASAVAAQKGSSEHRRQLQREHDERMAKAAEMLKEAGEEAGASGALLDKITTLLTTGGY